MTDRPALTLWQPWASLCVLPKPCDCRMKVGAGSRLIEHVEGCESLRPFKTIETRSWPAPKALIGQRIAIHAAKRRPKVGDPAAPWQALAAPINGGLKREIPTLPYGAVVGTAVLTDCVPMWAPNLVERPGAGGVLVGTTLDPDRLMLWRRGSTEFTDVTDQLPFGDFRPGRWAWLLADAEQFAEPIPEVGRQRVWRSKV